MTVIKDEWSGLFSQLEERVCSSGRRRLLGEMIGAVYDTTVLNFGDAGEHRPWEWADLSLQYALEKHEGDQTPTLILTGALRDGFVVEISDASATLTNPVEYANAHQFGTGRMHRPFYPVTPDGESLDGYMEGRMMEIADAHFHI